jgi:hypothetical protein
MSDTTKFISPFIQSQFPEFYRKEGKNFIAFVRAYYEWMESNGNTINYTRSLLDDFDIDTTATEFIKHFKATYFESLPNNIKTDKALLTKHILELYRSKGTPQAYHLLFRIIFNEDIDLYIPGDHLFTLSDAEWIVPQYIEVSDHVYLQYLEGKRIYNSSASGIVETVATKVVSGKVINVVFISNLVGNFKFGEKIFCDDLYVSILDNTTLLSGYEYSLLSSDDQANYSLVFVDSGAPIIIGSLSAVTVQNGGTDYSVGDLLSVSGSGRGGIAKVTSIKKENGKVKFTLVNGGFGFSTNAVVTVTSTSGAGATFAVNELANKTIFQINTDGLSSFLLTQLDADSSGFKLTVSNTSGNMTINEGVTASANSVELDVMYLTANQVNFGESLSNTSQNISGLYAYRAYDTLITVTGVDTQLTNANLVSGVVLTSPSGAAVLVNTVFPKQVISTTANVFSSNSTVLNVYNCNGYFVPTSIATGTVSGNTAKIVTDTRSTFWGGFPGAPLTMNLDTPLNQLLSYQTLEVGTIVSLKNVNPGTGYSSDPAVDIVEPNIRDLMIDDGNGGVWGHDAIVTGTALNASGIVTSVTILDSGFGYNVDETLNLNNSNNVTYISGTSVIDMNGRSSGYWNNRKSFLSDDNYLQDSYYYQSFSYEIAAKRMLSTYEKVVTELIHPAGLLLFGKFRSTAELTDIALTYPAVLTSISASRPVYVPGYYTEDGTGINAGGVLINSSLGMSRADVMDFRQSNNSSYIIFI